jgi:hypothetical protein
VRDENTAGVAVTLFFESPRRKGLEIRLPGQIMWGEDRWWRGSAIQIREPLTAWRTELGEQMGVSLVLKGESCQGEAREGSKVDERDKDEIS